MAGEVRARRRAPPSAPASRARWSPRTSALAVDEAPRFVSRGGIKLANALDATGVDPRRPAVPRRRRVDRRLHRLPAAARRRARDRGRRRLRRAGLGAAQRRARDRARAHQRARADARRSCPTAPDLIVADVSFISLTKVLPAVLACAAAALRRAGDGQAAVRGRPRRVGKGGVVRDPADRREALVRGRRGGARARGVACSASPRRACPGPRATTRRSSGSPRPGAPGAVADLEAAAPRGRAVSDAARTVTVLTHTRPGADRPRRCGR